MSQWFSFTNSGIIRYSLGELIAMGVLLAVMIGLAIAFTVHVIKNDTTKDTK